MLLTNNYKKLRHYYSKMFQSVTLSTKIAQKQIFLYIKKKHASSNRILFLKSEKSPKGYQGNFDRKKFYPNRDEVPSHKFVRSSRRTRVS